MIAKRAEMIDFLKRTGLYTPVRWTVKKSVPAFWVPYGAMTKRTDRALANYKRKNKVHKLHIGCGGNYLKGWFNTDLFPNARRTKLDSTKRFPYPDNTFDYIFTEHMIEHIPYAGGQVMLHECFRVLKPGGVLRVVTPDVKFLIGLYQDRENKLNQDYVRWNAELFLGKSAPHNPTSVINNYYRDWGHRYIYDVPVMRDALEKNGFTELTMGQIGKSAHPELSGLEHAQRMPDGFLELESMVIEAKKPTK
jgi:predicted SAM-dependent methyltransferase